MVFSSLYRLAYFYGSWSIMGFTIHLYRKTCRTLQLYRKTFRPLQNLDVQLSKGVAIAGLIGFLVRPNYPSFAILAVHNLRISQRRSSSLCYSGWRCTKPYSPLQRKSSWMGGGRSPPFCYMRISYIFSCEFLYDADLHAHAKLKIVF